jgi:hypothetical protein
MWKFALWLRNSFSRNICFQFLVLVLCSAVQYSYFPYNSLVFDLEAVKIKNFAKRFRDTTNSFNASAKRYVITNPPYNFKLLPTDQVFEHKIK